METFSGCRTSPERVEWGVTRLCWQGPKLVTFWIFCAQVRYELLGQMFRDRSLWRQLALSVVLNWLLGPLIMTGLAWACLPDAPMARFRNGVILVGLARCIAMVQELLCVCFRISFQSVSPSPAALEQSWASRVRAGGAAPLSLGRARCRGAVLTGLIRGPLRASLHRS